MEKIQAFPCAGVASVGEKFEDGNIGMDLRDYFAGKAMQGKLSHPDFIMESIKKLTQDAYLIADNMLTTREES